MTKKVRDFYTILGCRVGSTPQKDLLNDVRIRLTISRPLFMITPNSENVLGVYKNKNLQKLLKKVDYAPVDSIGLAAAVVFMNLNVPSNVLLRFPVLLAQGLYVGVLVLFRPRLLLKQVPLMKGRRLFLDLLQIANEKKWKVYLLGGESSEAKLTAQVISKMYKNISVKFSAGPLLDTRAVPLTRHDIKMQKQVLREIKDYKPHLLFVAFNFPKQEQWLAKHLPNLPVGLGMTVGGTFNYMSGKSMLPPQIVERLGFEWLWRLLNEPWRMKRVVDAVVVFPFTVFVYKLSNSSA